jgi:hypothetical protein
MEIVIQVQRVPDLFKAARAGQIEFWSLARTGDAADEFLRLFYDLNAGAVNLPGFRNGQFDALYT